jgi:hypothetical protein
MNTLAEIPVIGKRRVSPSDLGDARAIFADGMPTQLLMGRIVGFANSFSTRTSDEVDPATGEKRQYTGLRGKFQAIKYRYADGGYSEAEISESTLCYLPESLLQEALQRLERSSIKQGGVETKLAEVDWQFVVVRDANAQAGYHWEYHDLTDCADDPLASLKAKGAAASEKKGFLALMQQRSEVQVIEHKSRRKDKVIDVEANNASV